MSVNFFTDDSDKTSCPSDAFDDAYEVSIKTKVSQSSKKKKPKRNRSAFIIFSSEMRTKLRSDDREKLNSNEMMVKLAELWKNLPEIEKKKFYNQAEKEKERYHTELNSFYQNFPAEVIQNKTKKNHIKKPCSAYALYLKEKKQEIKNEKPDLKMADILKVVAERWKNLDDEERIIYQRMAQTEKEMAKAKLNEVLHLQFEEPVVQKKSAQSKKKVSSPKKGAKLSQELVKVEERDTKVEADFRSEEPAIVKKQQTFNFSLPTPNMGLPHFNLPFFFPPQNQPVMSHNSSNVTESAYKNDFIMPDFPYMNNPFSKLPSVEPLLMSKYSSKDEPRFSKGDSQVWNFPPENFMSKMPSDRLDLMNFHSFKLDNYNEFIKKEEEFTDSDDEYLASTATNLTPSSSVPATRTTMNNVLISALEPQSEFDPLNLDNAFDNFILLK